mmetsp:Transcript_36322/g.71787  ORF Transcript_36322/g.71787 Transcript_36322/m.71787 type:complete len:96 (+) Transcript_36322:854-1141(+)
MLTQMRKLSTLIGLTCDFMPAPRTECRVVDLFRLLLLLPEVQGHEAAGLRTRWQEACCGDPETGYEDSTHAMQSGLSSLKIDRLHNKESHKPQCR